MTGFLTNPVNLRRLFIALLFMTAMFGGVMAIWDFEIIDEMSNPKLIIAHIEKMTATQRMVHVLVTGTLDVAYLFVTALYFLGWRCVLLAVGECC